LLARDLVIWWDAKPQTWRVFDDQCPHRLASLSEGRINEAGLLECPYHGWSFSGSGQCEVIPQEPEEQSAARSQRACVDSLPTTVQQGLLFVFPGQAEQAAQTKVPLIEPLVAAESAQETGWVCLDTFRDLPYDALTLLENVLDPSHVPFTHHRSVGNRATASPVELELLEATKHGFNGTWADGPRRGQLGRQDTTFIAPNLMWHDLTSKQFGRTLTVVYATPIRKGECRIFARFPFRFSSPIPRFFIQLTPTWFSHIGQNRILEEDQIFLHRQERFLEAKGGSEAFSKAFYLPTRADRFVMALRQWVNQFQADPFACEPLGHSQTDEQLLDRYHSHTQHCKSCRTALENLKRIRQGSAAMALVLLALNPVLAIATPSLFASGLITTLTIGLGVLWYQLGQFEQRFYRGDRNPTRNAPERNTKTRS
jgi:phenylpropionate dioxygenase-like ring-hydroxylating dioxygenase large terminal subunit